MSVKTAAKRIEKCRMFTISLTSAGKRLQQSDLLTAALPSGETYTV